MEARPLIRMAPKQNETARRAALDDLPLQHRELVQVAMRAQGVVDRFDARETALEAQADRDAQDAREALHVFVMEGCS